MKGIRGLRELIGVRIINKIFVFGGIILLTDFFGSGTVGQYFLYEALVIVGSVFTNFGTARAVEQRISASSDRDTKVVSQYISAGMAIQATVLILLTFVLFNLSSLVENYLGAPLTAWVIAGMGLHAGGKLIKSALRATDRVSESATIEFYFRATWIVMTILLLLSGIFQIQVLAPVFGFLLGLLIQLLFGLVKLSIKPVIPARKTVKSVVSYGRFQFLTHIGGLSYSKGDVLILGIFVNPSAVAAYEIAWRTSTVVMLPIGTVASVVFPKLTEIYSHDNYDLFSDYLSQMLGIASLFAFPALLGTIVIAADFLTTIFSPEYAMAAIPLIILVGEKVPESYQSMFVTSLKAIDRPAFDAVTAITTAALNIIFNIILVTEFGILGAAVATATVSTLGTAMNYFFLRQYVPIEFPLKIMAASALAAGLMTVGVTFVHSAFEVSLLTVLFSVGVGFGIYSALVVLIEPLRECLRPLVTDSK